jgi:hypothetical protein
MGNEESEENQKEDYITFEVIQESLNIKDPLLFKKYLQEIFNDLSSRTPNSKNIKFMSRTTFYDYIKLPIFIAEKLYSSFSFRSKEGLLLEEFVNGFFNLYTGSFEDTAKIIFNLLDFNKDGLINNDDVKIILSYLPLNNEMTSDDDKKEEEELVTKIFGEQMKSLEEIDQIVKETFNKYDGEINLEQFIETIKNNNSEVYLQILCFLYGQIPFTSRNIDCIRKKYYSFDENEYEGIARSYRSYKSQNSIKIKTPKKTSMLSPAGCFLNKQLRIRSFSLNEEAKQIIKNELNGINISERKNTYTNENNSNSSSNKETTCLSNSIKEDKEENAELNNENIEEKKAEIKNKIKDVKIEDEKNDEKKNNDIYNKNIDIVRFDNENIIKELNQINNIDKNNIEKLCHNSKKNYVSPTKYLEEKACLNQITLKNASSSKYVENQLRTIKEENEMGEKNNLSITNANTNNDNEEEDIYYENWIYKITDDLKIKKYYLVLINKDIYYYSSQDKKDFLGMHNLSGCFIQESGEINTTKIDEKEFYKFEIYFNNKSKARNYYSLDYDIIKEFVQKIKKSIGYVKFSDLYEMKQVIGKGKFGVVNLGIHKKTGQQVAIKIMNKENIKTLEDKELVRIEIGILKLCHHPNIVRLLDHLENNNHIFIVMEYIEGGTLRQYFKKRKFNFSERQATNIMSQIVSGIKYLHQYGIVHRDLKPDNIMITQQNDFGIIKIMDFGLSKIVSPQEKMVDGYGSLSYVAPEILLRTPYNKEVDIWSIGVILFYMLCGHLPFRGSKEDIVANKIVFEAPEFDEEVWETRSKTVRNLIESCLEKKAKNRITIDQFINHAWFKKNMKQKYSI